MSAFCMAFSTQVAAIESISLAFNSALMVALGATTACGCLIDSSYERRHREKDVELDVRAPSAQFVVHVEIWPSRLDGLNPAVQCGDILGRICRPEESFVVLVEHFVLVVGNIRALAVPRHNTLAERGSIHY